jgi:hypothetical protein
MSIAATSMPAMGEQGSCVIPIARNLCCAISLLIARKGCYIARKSTQKLHRGNRCQSR